MVAMHINQGVHKVQSIKGKVQGVHTNNPGCSQTQSRVSRERSKVSMRIILGIHIVQDVKGKVQGVHAHNPG